MENLPKVLIVFVIIYVGNSLHPLCVIRTLRLLWFFHAPNPGETVSMLDIQVGESFYRSEGTDLTL